jgi:hypothetical protein
MSGNTITSKILALLGNLLLGRPQELFDNWLDPAKVPMDYYTEHADRMPATKYEIQQPTVQLERLAIDHYRERRVLPVAKLSAALGLLICAIGYAPGGIKATWKEHEANAAQQAMVAKFCAQPFIKSMQKLPPQCQ